MSPHAVSGCRLFLPEGINDVERTRLSLLLQQTDKRTNKRVSVSTRGNPLGFQLEFSVRIFVRKLHVRRRERLAARRCFYFDRRLVEQRLIALLRYLRSEQSRSHTAICAIAVALVGATIHAQSAWIIKPVRGGKGGTPGCSNSRSPFPVGCWSKFYPRETTPRISRDLLFHPLPSPPFVRLLLSLYVLRPFFSSAS